MKFDEEDEGVLSDLAWEVLKNCHLSSDEGPFHNCRSFDSLRAQFWSRRDGRMEVDSKMPGFYEGFDELTEKQFVIPIPNKHRDYILPMQAVLYVESLLKLEELEQDYKKQAEVRRAVEAITRANASYMGTPSLEDCEVSEAQAPKKPFWRRLFG